MALNPSIILSGQQFDLAGAMQTGLEMAARQKQFDQQNALANLYQTQGANIMAGDQNALAQLAQYDPAAALGIQSQRQTMAYQTEDQEMQRTAAQREAERYAKEVGAEKAAADAAELRANTMAALAAPTPEAFDAMMIENGLPDMVGQWENRQMLAIPYLEMADALDLIAPPEAPAIPADMLSLQMRAEAAGLQPGTPEYQDFMRQGSGGGLPAAFVALDLQAKAAGFEPGTPGYKEFMATRGAGLQAQAKVEGAAAGEAVTGLGSAVAKGQQALELIDQIAQDPALPSILGIVQGNIPAGTPIIGGGQVGADLGAKIEQLQGQVFLEAFESLKGGGAITEIEGQKAERAKARLSRAQSPEAYRIALNELREVIELGMKRAQERAQAAQGTIPGATAAPPAQTGVDLSDDDLLRMYGGE